MSGVDVLIFVEDPGAANYVAQLPQALQQAGISNCLLADGHAVKYLQDRLVSCVPCGADESALSLLGKYQPRLLMLGTSENKDSLALELIDTARSRQIISAAVVDLPVNADKRFKGRGDHPFTHRPDWILVPDEASKRAYEQLSFPARQLLVCGHPHYDQVLKFAATQSAQERRQLRKLLLPEAPEDRPVMVFLAEPDSVLDPQLSLKSQQYAFKGFSDSSSRTIIVFEEVLSVLGQMEQKPYLVVRLHPKNKPEQFAMYRQEIDFISSGGNPLELVYSADLVVGMSTMLLMEAALLRQNTLSVLPRECERQWLPCIAEGWIPCAMNKADLQTMLPDLIADAYAWRPAPALPIKTGSLEQVVAFVRQQLTTAECVNAFKH